MTGFPVFHLYFLKYSFCRFIGLVKFPSLTGRCPILESIEYLQSCLWRFQFDKTEKWTWHYLTMEQFCNNSESGGWFIIRCTFKNMQIIHTSVPCANLSNSKTPIGPFQMMVWVLSNASLNVLMESGPISNPIHPSGMLVAGTIWAHINTKL